METTGCIGTTSCNQDDFVRIASHPSKVQGRGSQRAVELLLSYMYMYLLPLSCSAWLNSFVSTCIYGSLLQAQFLVSCDCYRYSLHLKLRIQWHHEVKWCRPCLLNRVRRVILLFSYCSQGIALLKRQGLDIQNFSSFGSFCDENKV